MAAAAGIPRLGPAQSGTESEAPPADVSDRVLSLNRRLLALRRVSGLAQRRYPCDAIRFDVLDLDRVGLLGRA